MSESLKSFIKGVGSILNMYPELPPIQRKFIQSDEEAIEFDWKVVGQDLWNAKIIYDEEKQISQKVS